MYHIGLSMEDIECAKYAIITGDPGRVSKIARMFNNYKPLAINREYTSFLGEYDNKKILIISTGIGGPSTAICIEELYLLGVKNIIRVGTCGGMQPNIDSGDLIIATSAIRQEGTSKEYVPIEFPAVANIDMINALKDCAKNLGYKYYVGVVQSKDSFYGQHKPDDMPIAYELKEKWDAWIKAGCLASEMETATLYTVSQIRGIKAASILTTIWNQEKDERFKNLDTYKVAEVAVEAIKSLINEENSNE